MPFGLVRFFDVQIKVEATAIFGLLDAVAIVFFSHPSNWKYIYLYVVFQNRIYPQKAYEKLRQFDSIRH